MNEGRYKTLSFTRAQASAAFALALAAAVLVPLAAIGGPDGAPVGGGLEETAAVYLRSRATASVEAAALSLVAAGAPAVPVVLRAVDGDRARERAARLFARAGEASFAALFAQLADPELGSRAASALVDLSTPGDGRHAPALLDCIRRHPALRQSCAMALVHSLSPKAGRQLKALEEALKDPDPEVRAFAAAGLTQLGQKAKGALETLVLALGDASPAVRWGAADALGAIGRGARSAVPKLKALASDPDPEVRRRTAEALEKIGG